MRIRTVAGLTIAGAAATAAIAGGVAIATADEADPVVRIVTEEQPAGDSGSRSIQDGQEDRDGRDCPDKTGGTQQSPTGTGL